MTQGSMPCRIIVADDHPLMRGALVQALARSLAPLVVCEAGTLDEVVAALRSAPADAMPDLILLDLNMPGMNGFAGLLLVRAEFPSIPVVIISASEEAATIGRTIDYGAAGFIPKSAPSERISEAVAAVLRGDLWFPAQALSGKPQEDAELAARLAALTPQQLRVFMMISEGKLNKQIAHEIQVAEATVKAHVTMILRKLGVGSRTQAAILARRLVVDQPAR
jgi:DNA-binding NarL/FixJ family response regulator